ncbi:hypothetical protein ACLB2K_051760 [Fragaria x ananassa]
MVLVVFPFAESKFIAYNTTSQIVPGKLNVHIVPHTHDDVGWVKTVDQYYTGANNSLLGFPACVRNVLDSLVPALLADKNRKFIYAEQAFFQLWWREQSEAIQDTVKQLVSSGQLEFINGGMCMHDEAATHYIDMIDQTTLGHRFIKQEFNVTPRVGWQIDTFGHSSVQAYLLGAEVGFDSLFFGRIDYQDKAKRKDDKSLEVVWRGSKSLGSSAQIFAGAFPGLYVPPSDNFYFETDDPAPLVQDDMNLGDYNMPERVNDFVSEAISQVIGISTAGKGIELCSQSSSSLSQSSQVSIHPPMMVGNDQYMQLLRRPYNIHDLNMSNRMFWMPSQESSAASTQAYVQSNIIGFPSTLQDPGMSNHQEL